MPHCHVDYEHLWWSFRDPILFHLGLLHPLATSEHNQSRCRKEIKWGTLRLLYARTWRHEQYHFVSAPMVRTHSWAMLNLQRNLGNLLVSHFQQAKGIHFVGPFEKIPREGKRPLALQRKRRSRGRWLCMRATDKGKKRCLTRLKDAEAA